MVTVPEAGHEVSVAAKELAFQSVKGDKIREEQKPGRWRSGALPATPGSLVTWGSGTTAANPRPVLVGRLSWQ